MAALFGGGMATYAFETITAEQALGLTGADQVRVASGPAEQTTVVYQPDQTVAVTVAGRTVVFGPALSQVSFISHFTYADGSEIYVGDATGNVQSYQSGIVGVDRHGAAYGGGGDDRLAGTGLGTWLMQGNQGDDSLSASNLTHNTIYGGQGNDLLDVFSNFLPGGLSDVGSFLQGNKGDDTLAGSGGGDTLLGGQGADTIYGSGGADIANGNLGDDYVYAGGLVLGEGGNDTLYARNDVATTVQGGAGSDRIETDSFLEDLAGVTLLGEDGNDTITGGTPFRDLFDGGAGNDAITAQGGAGPGDLLLGGEGDDSLWGQAAGDTLQGGAGADTLQASNRDNVLVGGAGADVFMFGSGDTTDTIIDWSSDDLLLTRHAATNYTEATAVSRDAAFELARSTMGQPATGITIMAIQVGGDVIVFSGRVGLPVDAALTLVGRTLDDVSPFSLV